MLGKLDGDRVCDSLTNPQQIKIRNSKWTAAFLQYLEYGDREQRVLMAQETGTRHSDRKWWMLLLHMWFLWFIWQTGTNRSSESIWWLSRRFSFPVMLWLKRRTGPLGMRRPPLMDALLVRLRFSFIKKQTGGRVYYSSTVLVTFYLLRPFYLLRKLQ